MIYVVHAALILVLFAEVYLLEIIGPMRKNEGLYAGLLFVFLPGLALMSPLQQRRREIDKKADRLIRNERGQTISLGMLAVGAFVLVLAAVLFFWRRRFGSGTAVGAN